MNPKLIIDMKKFTHNARYLAELCAKNGVSMAAVTKVYCAARPMVEAIAALPIKYLADSRLENIVAYPMDIPQQTMLLRLPSPSMAEKVVAGSDISLNSEIFTLGKLADAAASQGKQHGIILMIDLGDLREGIYYDKTAEIEKAAEFILSQKSLRLEGFGTNLTCFGGVLPSVKNLTMLSEICYNVSRKFSVEIPVVSGGNSSSLHMLGQNQLPAGINNLRFGDATVSGYEAAHYTQFPGLELDAITLHAEIIETYEKPSMPEGETNVNAFGEVTSFDDKGMRKRAIVAVGRQDTQYDGLTPHMQGATIEGASSDHLIVDITDAAPLAVGDWLTFSLSYGAILAGFTSRYVDKDYRY